ncbi:MAG: hypothetical protein K2M19_06970 [Muribaculaceae bacterium]|nr:hypothetical protein [Muribaculaceae bacterium]
MKKYFTFALACAVALSVSADTWKSIGNATVYDGWITPGYVDDDGKQLNPSDFPFEVPVEESVETPGVYRLINPFGSSDFHLSSFNVDGSAHDIVIDARDRTFVLIQPQYCGFTDLDSSEASGRYPYYLSDMGTYMWNLGQQREVINLLRCASTMSGNVIYVPQPTFGTTADHAIEAWETSYPAQIILPNSNRFDETEWEILGKATMVDGWIVPGFKDENDRILNPDDYPFEVSVYMNSANPDILCIRDPYHTADFPLVSHNLTNTPGYITIDTSDPEFVTVEPQFSGFIARSENDILQYFITEAGSYMLSKGYTREEIISRGNNSTYDAEAGVLRITTPLFGFDADNVGKVWNNPHATVLTFNDGKGISSAVISAPDAEAVYYNLQGVEVPDPSAGLFIEAKGNVVRKVIIR